MTPRTPPPAAPTSTWHQRIGFLNSVSSSTSSTRPIVSVPTDPGTDLLDGLDLETGPDQARGHVASGLVGRNVDEFSEP